MPSATTSRPQRVWELRPQSPAAAKAISEGTGLSALSARVMAARGWDDPVTVQDFLSARLSGLHDPFDLPGMAIATERLVQAIRDQESICIFGDYDVDGTTGSAVLMKTLRWLGAERVAHRTPDRLLEGYGLQRDAVAELARDGVQLIVTVDNGTTATEALEHAQALGVEVIVTDHHQPDSTLPPTLALINPWRADSTYPFPDLCGCGVAFKLAQALTKAMGREADEAKPFLMSLIDLVALGTVADIVPIHGENRALVRHGLVRLEDSPHAGVRALMQVARLNPPLKSDSIGWVIGPRINAASRTSHGSIAFELLTTEDDQRALEIARELETLNTERRKIEQAMLTQALEELEAHREDPVVILARPGWHRGVIGIVASRILDRVERPVLLLAIEGNMAHGSGRSIPGFDLHAALTACASHLAGFGGHPMAAGVTCEVEKIDAFRDAMIEHALSLGPEALAPRTRIIDAEIRSEDLTPEVVEDLARLEPHGECNPRPLFALRDLQLAATPKVIKANHLKLRVVTPEGRALDAMAWRTAERLGELVPSPRRVDLLGRPVINAWNGNRSVEFETIDWRVTEP